MSDYIRPTDYPAIRAALDITLDEAALPDTTIAMDVYLGAAEREVRASVSLPSPPVGENLERVRTAIILITAANLAPAIPQMQSEQLGDYLYKKQAVDWKKLAEELRSRANSELTALLTTDIVEQATRYRHTSFAAATGRRGRG